MSDLSDLDEKEIIGYALKSGLVKVKNDIAEITWEDIKQLKLGVGKTPFSVRVKMEDDGTVTPTIMLQFGSSNINSKIIDSKIDDAIQEYERQNERL